MNANHTIPPISWRSILLLCSGTIRISPLSHACYILPAFNPFLLVHLVMVYEQNKLFFWTSFFLYVYCAVCLIAQTINLLEKLIFQHIKKLSPFYKTQTSISLFTEACPRAYVTFCNISRIVFSRYKPYVAVPHFASCPRRLVKNIRSSYPYLTWLRARQPRCCSSIHGRGKGFFCSPKRPVQL
jgi:hypothetical protein